MKVFINSAIYLAFLAMCMFFFGKTEWGYIILGIALLAFTIYSSWLLEEIERLQKYIEKEKEKDDA